MDSESQPQFDKVDEIPYEEYIYLQQLLSDREKHADYLDYLHVQDVKAENPGRTSLNEVKKVLDLE